MDHRDRVLAFRADGHRLDRRGSLLEALGAIGVRDVQGSAAVALHARVSGFSADMLEGDDVVEVASSRGVSTLVPLADVDVFTLGTLPGDDASLRHRLKPFEPDSPSEALARAVDVAREALADGPLEIAGLSGALTRALPELSPMCRGRCGVEHIDQGLFELVGQAGTWRRDRDRRFVALPEPSTSPTEARAELVRRYLGCHGPSTAKQFADWCGISPADARGSLATSETTEISRGTYLLTRDLDRFEDPPPPRGVRLLPPRDPYLEGRDRATLVPDRDVQRTLWRAIPTLGVVLVDGDAAATWKAKKTGTQLQLIVERFGEDPVPDADLEAEAAAVAELRGCDSVGFDHLHR